MPKMKFDLGKHTKCAQSQCCECGHKVDAASGPCAPEKGDFSLRVYCGCLNIFDDGLSLRKPSDDEMLKAAASREVQIMRAAIEKVSKAMKETKGSDG